jgi:hypothetical protein
VNLEKVHTFLKKKTKTGAKNTKEIVGSFHKVRKTGLEAFRSCPEPAAELRLKTS